jgi:hypothetical protein
VKLSAVSKKMIYFKVVNWFILKDKCHITYEQGEIFYFIPDKNRMGSSKLLVRFVNGDNAGTGYPFEDSTYSEFRKHIRNGDVLLFLKNEDYC